MQTSDTSHIRIPHIHSLFHQCLHVILIELTPTVPFCSPEKCNKVSFFLSKNDSDSSSCSLPWRLCHSSGRLCRQLFSSWACAYMKKMLSPQSNIKHIIINIMQPHCIVLVHSALNQGFGVRIPNQVEIIKTGLSRLKSYSFCKKQVWTLWIWISTG